MLVDQMIFTACGKDKNGAYSVWSKSQNVTDSECEEIHELMSYVQSQNAPYKPTAEQVNDKKIYPPKYGYFGLSSGRVCVAKSSYIGLKYSDFDKRYGNYIIHAFIFDNKFDETFSPLSIFDLKTFKSELTYKEWHDNPAPEFLPQLEIQSTSTANESFVRNFCATKGIQTIESLLQAAADIALNDEDISFNDSEENQKEIYALLGILLPNEIQRHLFFLTQFTLDLEYRMRSKNMPQIKVRNIFSDVVDNSFNYQDQLNVGKSVFNFQSGAYANIKSKRYVTDIINTLMNQGIESAKKKAIEVNKIMQQTNCDIDSAIAVYYLGQQNIQWFNGLNEYEMALDIATKTNLIDKSAIASKLMTDIIKTKKWGSGKAIIDIIKFTYNYSNQNDRKFLVEDYLRNSGNYGVDTKLPPMVYVQQMKQNAPFAWKDVEATFINDPKWEASISNISNTNELYLLFDTFTEVLTKDGAETVIAVAKRCIFKIYKTSITKYEFGNIQLYNNRLKILGNIFQSALLKESLGASIEIQIKDGRILEFIIKVILDINDDSDKVKLLTTLTLTNLSNSEFLPLYIKYSAQEQQYFIKVERMLSGKDEFNKFLFKKEAYLFNRLQNITFKQLDDYFNKFYIKGYDTGIYCTKVKEYLRSQLGKNLFAECLKIYDQIKNLGVEKFSVLEILKVIETFIYSISIEELLNSVDGKINVLLEIESKLIRSNCAVSSRQKILFEILFLRRLYNKDNIEELIQRDAVYENLNQSQLGEFVSHYFNEALDFYLYCRDENLADIKTVVISVFRRPLSLGNASAFILSGIRALSTKKYYQVLNDLLTVGLSGDDNFSIDVKIILDRYIQNMKKREIKKLSSNVEKLASSTDLPQIRAYFDEYFETNTSSSFGKLFSKNNKKGGR